MHELAPAAAFLARSVPGFFPHVFFQAAPWLIAGGALAAFGGALIALRGVTGRRLTRRALERSEARHRAMIANISDVIVILGADSTIRYVSPNVEGRFGRRAEALIGTNSWDAVHPDDQPWLQERFAALLAGAVDFDSVVFRYRHNRGDYRVIEAEVSNRLGDPDIGGLLMSCHDITEKRGKEEEVLYLSRHDGLTGLYNRAYLEQELRRLGKAAQRPFSMIMGDVNGLKLTNDVFGYAQGDRLLLEIAGILRRCCGEGDTVARVGGDEFCILLPGAGPEEANGLCKRIYAACLQREIALGDGTLHPSISLGYSSSLCAAQPVERLFKEAEDFLYRRKLLERKSMHSSLIASIQATLYEKSHETRAHADRLIAHSRAMGQRLRLAEEQLDELELLATLHDIGKISVDDRILASPGALSERDWQEMKRHPEVGYRIALAAPELRPIADYILCHHERWDGGGYPRGLRGPDIPLQSRILAVADAYDAMTHDRAYRKAMPREQALRELAAHAGAQFDPDIVRVFLEIV